MRRNAPLARLLRLRISAEMSRPFYGNPFTRVQIHPHPLRRPLYTRAIDIARIAPADSHRRNNVPHVAATHLHPCKSTAGPLRRPICTRATHPAHSPPYDLFVLSDPDAERSTSFAPLQCMTRTRAVRFGVNPSCSRRRPPSLSFRPRLHRPLRREPLCCAHHRKTNPAWHCRAGTPPPRGS